MANPEVAKPDLGLKRVCVSCGAKFFDLARAPAVCPKCGTEQPAEQPRLRRPVAPLPEEKVKKRPAAAAIEGVDAEVEDVEGDEASEDAEELEDDAEAISEDIEVAADHEEET